MPRQPTRALQELERDRFWAGGLFLSAAAVYLSFLSQSFVFEGLARAMPIELGRWQDLCPGNYVLYGPVAFAFHQLLQLLKVPEMAVRSLQILDALLGAAGLSVFFLTLRELGAERPAAAAWAAALGACLGFWLWSSDAQVYIFSTFLLAVNWLFLIRALNGRFKSALALGLLGALAVLGHIVNVLFLTVGAWIMRRIGGRKSLLRYGFGAMAGILGCYAIVLKIVVRPASGSAAWRWFLNSAAGSAGLSWHGGFWSLARLGQWLRMTLNIFVSFGGSFNSPAPWPMSGALLPAARLALLAAAVIAAAGLLRLKKERRVVALACVLWLAVYGAFFTSWEPYTMVYRVGDLIPFMTLLYLGLSEPRMGAWSGAALAVLLGAANFSAEIYPRSFSTNNPDLQRMLFIKAHTSGSDWVTGSGGEDELYLPYFAQRRPLVLGQFESRPEELDRLVTELLRSGQGVYATSRSLSEPAWASFFARWKPQPAATDGAGFTLYRLASPR